jgi:acetoacetate decarboxylase
MFEFDPKSSYMMPAHFGPRPMSPKASGWYRDVTAMVLSYLTDREQLARYLPEPFEVGEEALVSVFYARNRQVDWLAGHGYNMIAVNASAVFKGDRDELTGQYTLVMWENLTDPILTGRELQGIPKIYADIPDHSVIAGEWRASASHFGHKIVDMAITDLRAATQEEIEAGRGDEADSTPMAWRYLPGVSGFGQTTSEPTAYPSESEFTSVLVGDGSIDWHELTWEQNPTQFHIVNALASLPILEQRPALVTKGSTNLILLDRLPRGIS